MGRTNRSFGLIRRAAMPALALIVIGNFAGYAVAGPNGLLAWGGYHRDLGQRRVELASLEVERDRLRHHSKLLDPQEGRSRHGRRTGPPRPRPGPPGRSHPAA